MSACLSFYLLDLLTKEELWYVRFTLQLRLRTPSYFVWPAVVRSSCSRPLHHEAYEGGALMWIPCPSVFLWFCCCIYRVSLIELSISFTAYVQGLSMVFAAKLTVDFGACLTCDATIVPSRYASSASTEDTDTGIRLWYPDSVTSSKTRRFFLCLPFFGSFVCSSSLREGVVSS